MSVPPVVRYMLLCSGWSPFEGEPRRFNILGLLSSIQSQENPKTPFVLGELCVFLSVTAIRGSGTAEIVCEFADTGDEIFRTAPRTLTANNDPLEVHALVFRVRGCLFPELGLYTIQFRYNRETISEQILLVR